MKDICPVCSAYQKEMLEFSDESEIIREMICDKGHRWRHEYERDWNADTEIFRQKPAL
ncbi:MAG: hypothetical protein ABW110_19850 [Steroidobacteraceae bacterium]